MPKIKMPNRLAQEKSPYLLQHAHNPVDWYPWGEEAFLKANGEDKPVFLSIGYSTCHWCHVMERESFEDEQVADVLNQYFVSIKVDREERPDVDQIYMNVCQAMTGQGGWPLTILMTPEKKPFFAGTYFPKESKWGRPGLVDLLSAVHEKWKQDRKVFLEHSERILEALQENSKETGGEKLDATTSSQAYHQLEEDFDPEYGGFGDRPKFPTPHNLMFLLRYWKRVGEEKALQMVEKTLQGMRQGGIYDHLGYGFSRYSVDEKWLIPHFEKMLYDNALLVYTYLEAYQCTGKREYAKVVEEVLAYIAEKMLSPEGGFYSAQDADSEGEEGKFYVWTQDEVMGILGWEEGQIFCSYYNVTAQGNFEHQTNALNTIGQDLSSFAANFGKLPEEVEEMLERSRKKLYSVREKRIPPYKDDKVLTAWNGLMIAACAKAGAVLGKNKYKEMAKNALDFLYAKLVREDGRLLARFRDGNSAFPAYLDDYAFLLWGLLELSEATFEFHYLEKAKGLAQEIDRLFYDQEKGGYYFSGEDAEKLLVRPKEIYDGAIPSGNSVIALSFFRLAGMLKEEKWEKRVREMLDSFAGTINRYPRAYTFFLLALEWSLFPPAQLAFLGRKEDSLLQEMMVMAQKDFKPGRVLIYQEKEEKSAAYLCENFACLPPATTLDELQKLLGVEEKILGGMIK